MLQTLGLWPLLPPPRGRLLSAGRGTGLLREWSTVPAAPRGSSSELSGSWRGLKDTEQRPGMSFVPVALLCSLGVLREFVTHCGFLRVQSCWRRSDSGLDSVPSCGAPASSSALPKDVLTVKGPSKSAWTRGSLRMGLHRTLLQAPEHPGEQAPPYPAGSGGFPLPSTE